MRPEALDEEVNAAASYRPMLQAFKRISADTVEVITLESETILLHISRDGWKIHQSEADPFPTFEAALMAHSPKFTEKWNQELERKLALLANDQR